MRDTFNPPPPVRGRQSAAAPCRNSPRMMAVFERIANERLRQRQLFAEKRISFNVAGPVANNDQRLRVLVEEVGQVAQAIDRHALAQAGRDGPDAPQKTREDLREKLVQVAAVATAWLESMEATL